MSRKVAIVVGNGHIKRDISTILDNANFVMRFNEPNLAGGWNGTGTDILVLSISSKQFQRRLAHLSFLENAVVKAASMARGARLGFLRYQEPRFHW